MLSAANALGELRVPIGQENPDLPGRTPPVRSPSLNLSGADRGTSRRKCRRLIVSTVVGSAVVIPAIAAVAGVSIFEPAEVFALLAGHRPLEIPVSVDPEPADRRVYAAIVFPRKRIHLALLSGPGIPHQMMGAIGQYPVHVRTLTPVQPQVPVQMLNISLCIPVYLARRRRVGGRHALWHSIPVDHLARMSKASGQKNEAHQKGGQCVSMVNHDARWIKCRKCFSGSCSKDVPIIDTAVE